MASSPRRRSKSLPGLLPEAASGEVLVWTDGACQRNPGPGGWAALLCWEDGVVEEHSDGLAHTTNNIMEMTAAGGLARAAVRVTGLRRDRLAVPARRHDLLDGRVEAQGLEDGFGRPGQEQGDLGPARRRSVGPRAGSLALGQGARRARASRASRLAGGRRHAERARFGR